MEQNATIGGWGWICSGLLWLFLTTVGSAATRTVTNTDDSGPGSLRDTIGMALAGDTIVFGSGDSGATITLTSGELMVDKTLVIDASGLEVGMTISAGGDSRVFRTAPDTVVVLDGLTIRDGRAPAPEHGGGIFNSGTLTLVDCSVAGNRSGSPREAFAPAGGGGGIFNEGILTVTGSTVSDNEAMSVGGGILNSDSGECRIELSVISGNRSGHVNHGRKLASGGGVYSEGGLEVFSSRIESNRSGIEEGDDTDADPEPGACGGGIYSAGPCKLTDAVITGNCAGTGVTTFHIGGPGGSGGGVFSVGTLEVAGSLISRNCAGAGGRGASGGSGAGGDGGGILALGACVIRRSVLCENMTGVGGGGLFFELRCGSGGGIYAAGALEMENSSVLGNVAFYPEFFDSFGGDGAGIFASHTAVLTHCTVAFNITDNHPLTPPRGGGLAMAGGSTSLELNASVIAENVASNNPDLSRGKTTPVRTTVHGRNFVGEAADVEDFFAGFISGNPVFSLPGDFGLGLTAALPLPGSPLIDSANLPAPLSLPIDQRGEPREVADIGAIEVVAGDSQFYAEAVGELRIISIPMGGAGSPGRNRLTLQRRSTRTIALEYSPDFRAGSWIDLGDFIFKDGETIGYFTDDDPARVGRSAGFYRAVPR